MRGFTAQVTALGIIPGTQTQGPSNPLLSFLSQEENLCFVPPERESDQLFLLLHRDRTALLCLFLLIEMFV